MAALLAFVATILTSLLPILNKRLLRDARPALVAWVVNAASLPILLAGTLLLTQCSVTSLHGSVPFSCTARLPHIDGIFVAALVASALLNWAATLLSTIALARADASLVSPLLTFNPAFTLLLAWPTLGETPGLPQTMGVALLGTFLLVVLLTPGVLRLSQPERPSPSRGTWQGLRPHARALFAAIALAGVAPLFGFTAIALGLVGYVTTLFKLSAIFTILW